MLLLELRLRTVPLGFGEVSLRITRSGLAWVHGGVA